MKQRRLYQVDAFTTVPFEGNPAGVVVAADGLSDGHMQAIARELGNPETAFLLQPSGDDHDVCIRFFTPTTEVPSCGHATVAAHYVRAIENDLPSCILNHKIGIGVLPIEILRRGDDCEVIITQGPPEISAPFDPDRRDEILAALGVAPRDWDDRCPPQIASTGHSKVMVGLTSRHALDALRPDLPQLARISGEIGCNGYFAFVLNSSGDGPLSYGRMFAPAIGIAEDPVTGNANGPLGAYLVHHRLAATQDGVLEFVARQGDAMGRPGTMRVIVDADGDRPTRVRIGGRAVVVFRAELGL